MPLLSSRDQRHVVLHVVFSLDPGGMENGVVNLVNGLDEAGFESHVYCLDRLGSFASRIKPQDRVHVHGRRTGFSPRALMAFYAPLVDELAQRVAGKDCSR